ncbi:MAG: DMT family transporter [Chloroflexota bacterium]|nr:DMT family transporter [Chloroflexota bacterium]
MTPRRIGTTYAGLATGVAAVSFAAVLIREAGEAPALVIAAYRLSIATLVIAPITLALARRDLLRLTRRELFLALCAGGLLAVHFASWIASLERTSVASSVVLVTATPLMVAVASRLLFKESLARRVLVGIGLGLAGSLAIAWGDLGRGGGEELLGDGLALLGAVAMTGYLLIGRRLRASVPVLPYLTIVYGCAALLLLAAAGASGASLVGYSGRTYTFLVLIALAPQVVGHSLLNWTLARVTATVVSVSVMAEPVASTLLAYLILHETPPATSLAGGAVILAGIYLALRRRPSRNIGTDGPLPKE